MSKDVCEIIPELSVILPAYNASKTIARALRSLLDQTVSLDRYEILVIDDGSTDDTWEICTSFAETYPNIRVRHQENGGVSSARNHGLNLARGQWVTFVDSDDYVTQDYVNTVVTTAPDTDYLIFNHFLQEDTKSIVGKPWIKALAGQEIDIHQVMLWICDNRLNSPWDKRFSLSVIQKNKIRFPENIHMGEDLLFNFSYGSCVSSAFVGSCCIYCYVDNFASATHKCADFKRYTEYETIYHFMMRNSNRDVYRSVTNLSFLRVIAIYAGQLHEAGYSADDIYSLFDKSDMFKNVMLEPSWNIKNILRKIMLRFRFYGMCAVFCRG